MRSLRSVLTLGTALAAGAVGVVAAVALYGLVRAALLAQFDQALLDKAQLLTSTVTQQRGRLHQDFDQLDLSEFERRERPAYLQVWRPDGASWYRGRSLGAANLPAVAAGTPAWRWLRLPDGRPGRAVGIRFVPRQDEEEAPSGPSAAPGSAGPQVTLVLARDTLNFHATLVRLRWLLLLVGLCGGGALAVLLPSVVRWGLRPLGDVGSQIEALDADGLSRRLVLDHPPRELEPVVRQLNDLLDRLAAAFVRERSFSADVAHELRTPLAGLRTSLEVTLARRRDADAYQASLRDCLDVVVQLQAMVENLLSLTRLEAGLVELRPTRVDVVAQVRDAFAPLASTSEQRGLRVDWFVADTVPVATDPTLLALVLRNVVANAVAYADAGSRLSIEVAAGPDGAQVQVRNTGSRVAAADVAQVFERFWRGDQARSETGLHCGLGLPLVRTVMTVLGGTAAVESQAGGEFVVRLQLPHAPP